MKFKNAMKKSFALIVIGLITFSACKKKDDDPAPQNPITLPPPPGQKTIVELAVERGFDSLAVALTQTGLISEFDQVSDGQSTVFAPTNLAFRNLLSALSLNSISEVNNEVLSEILLYHVIGSEVKSNRLADGQLIRSLSGFTYRVNLSGGARLFTTASSSTNITATDIDASNGVIHVIDAVLIPDAPGIPGNTSVIPTKTIATTAGDAGLDSLVVALTRLNLVSTFADTEARFTVFAPTNQAFVNLCGALGVSSIAEIDLGTLTAAITYHAVDGIISSSQLASGQAIRPLNTTANPPIRVEIGGSVQLRDVDNGLSTVTSADVWCTNGVVHVIDRVLLPIDL